MGKITYCIVDETDPEEVFECEGDVIRTFFVYIAYDSIKEHAEIKS